MVEQRGLESLESAVRGALKEITALRKQNRTLASQAKRQRRQLAELPAGRGAVGRGRQELKKSLRELISTLESVLAD
jgi:propanediol dehydratase small subunit